MPYSKQHKQQSRMKILDSAFALFTEFGFESTSIDDITAAAGLTRGAFYGHFSSKSELYQEALIHAAEKTQERYRKPDKLNMQSWLKVLLRGYLHKDHIDQEGTPSCPLAFLATDVAIRDEPVREAYTDAFRDMTGLIANYTEANTKAEKKSVYAATAMLIGAVAVARALDDEALCRELLDSCKTQAKVLLDQSNTQ